MNRRLEESGAAARGAGLTDERPPLAVVLMHLGERMHARVEAALEPLGLSLAKTQILRHLVRGGSSLPLSRLAELNACARSNITQLVDRLEADGLVRRVQDPADRRGVLAEITEEGRERYRRVGALVREREAMLEGVLGARELMTLRGLLARLQEYEETAPWR